MLVVRLLEAGCWLTHRSIHIIVIIISSDTILFERMHEHAYRYIDSPAINVPLPSERFVRLTLHRVESASSGMKDVRRILRLLLIHLKMLFMWNLALTMATRFGFFIRPNPNFRHRIARESFACVRVPT